MAFRTLIIGSGFGSRVVSGCYEEAGMEVQVVTPRDPDAVRKACAEPFDLVSVHTPPHLHAEYVNLALDHGRNVLCDKPFGVSVAQAQQMLDRAREKGVIHLLNFEFRYDPGRLRVKEILDSGAIGKVVHVNWAFFNAFSKIPLRKHGWQFDKDMGGGIVRIIATHTIDALRWLVGEVADVDCRGRIEVRERPDADGKTHISTAEDAFTAFLTMQNGATAVVDHSWASPGTLPDHWTIIGTEGIIEVTERIELYLDPLVRDAEIKIIKGGKEQVEHVGPFEGDAHLPAMRPWSKAIREAVTQRRQIVPSFGDGVACSQVVERLHAAMAKRGSN